MRTVNFEYRGQVLHLCLNGAALFAIRDEYGSETPIFDLIAGDGSEAFQRMCRILHILCEQGELMERYLGQEPQEVPTERYLVTTMMPSDLPAVREAMARAVAAGFRREVPDDKPKRRDLGLEELQKKNGTRRPVWLQVGTQVLGLSPREALLLTPGTLLDLLTLERKRRGWGDQEEDA